MPTPVPDQDAARTLIRDRIAQLDMSVRAVERAAGVSQGVLHGFLKADDPEGISAATLFSVCRGLGVRLTAAKGRPPGAEPVAAKKSARSR